MTLNVSKFYLEIRDDNHNAVGSRFYKSFSRAKLASYIAVCGLIFSPITKELKYYSSKMKECTVDLFLIF